MRSGVYAICVFLILVLSINFVSAGLFCDIFGGTFCDESGRELRGELFQSGAGSSDRLIAHIAFEDNVNDLTGNSEIEIPNGFDEYVDGVVGRAGKFSESEYVVLEGVEYLIEESGEFEVV